MSHETERVLKPGVRVSRPGQVAASARNLTCERQLAYLTRLKSEALAKIDPSDVAVVTVPKLKDGKPVLDNDNFPVLVEKKRLRRDVVAEEFDSRIEAHKASFGLK